MEGQGRTLEQEIMDQPLPIQNQRQQKSEREPTLPKIQIWRYFAPRWTTHHLVEAQAHSLEMLKGRLVQEFQMWLGSCIREDVSMSTTSANDKRGNHNRGKGLHRLNKFGGTRAVHRPTELDGELGRQIVELRQSERSALSSLGLTHIEHEPRASQYANAPDDGLHMALQYFTPTLMTGLNVPT